MGKGKACKGRESLMTKERWFSGGDIRHDPGVGTSLDEVAKGLASGTISRGKVLRWMGAALVGGALASVRIGEAAGDDLKGCKPEGKKCRKDKQCCSGNCDSSSGTCKPLSAGPNLVLCFCQDASQIDTCASIDCFSGPAREEVCGPLCETRGGIRRTICRTADPVCSE